MQVSKIIISWNCRLVCIFFLSCSNKAAKSVAQTIENQRVSVGTGIPSSRYECVMQIYFLTRESVSRYKQPLRLCIRNNTQGLRTLNIIVFTFFYNINKGDLPLMYSCVLWCEFIDLLVFYFRIMKRVSGVTQ